MFTGFFKWLSNNAKAAVLNGVNEAVAELNAVDPGEDHAVILRLEVLRPALPAPEAEPTRKANRK